MLNRGTDRDQQGHRDGWVEIHAPRKLAASSTCEPEAATLTVPIRSQIARILESEGFFHSKRMQRFLEFIVEETLASRGEQLCEYVVGVAVFDQPKSFEPGLNPIVRNEARRLRQKLHEYYRHPKLEPDRFLIDVPKGSYLPVFHPIAIDPAVELMRPPAHIRLVVLLNGKQLYATEFDSLPSEPVDLQLQITCCPDKTPVFPTV